MKRQGRFGKDWIVVLIALVALAGGGSRLYALIGDTPTIRHMDIGPVGIIDPKSQLVALIGETPLVSNRQLLVGLVNPKTQLVVDIPADVTPVDVLVSEVFKPGSVLVLDSSLKVHEFMIAIDADGKPKLAGTAVHDFGLDPAMHGMGTALAEAMSIVDPEVSYLGIGTDAGRLCVIANGTECVEVATTPVLDLEAVPQVGTIAFVAVTFDKANGARLIGIDPDSNTDGVLDPVILFGLADLRPHPILDVGLIDPKTQLTDPEAVPLVAADGTGMIYRLTIPPDPQMEMSFMTEEIGRLGTPIIEVAAGSLALLPADGSGGLHDPDFKVAAGGITDSLVTLFGESLTLSPKTLRPTSCRRFITAVIEVAGGAAASIDPASVRLEINDGTVFASSAFMPQLGDDDHDGVADLKLKFDRAAVQGLIPSDASAVEVLASWSYTDGSSASAGATLRIIQGKEEKRPHPSGCARRTRSGHPES